MTTKNTKSNITKSTAKAKTDSSKPKVETKVNQPKTTPSIKKYNPEDEILCKSVCFGLLEYMSKKDGLLYRWEDFGDIVPVRYSDLLALKTSRSKFLYQPWFIILDEELVDIWKLREINKYFDKISDIEDFLIDSDVKFIKKQLTSAPDGYKDLVIQTAGRLLRENRLDSIAKLRVIDDLLNTKLSLLIGG